MSMQLRAFRPLGVNKTVNVAVLTTNVVLTLPDTPFGTRAIRLVNAGTQTIFIELGGASAVASLTTSIPMFANTTEVFTLSNDITSIATISTATGSTLYATYGEGL